MPKRPSRTGRLRLPTAAARLLTGALVGGLAVLGAIGGPHIVAATFAGPDSAAPPPAAPGSSPPPGPAFFVDPEAPAARQVAEWEAAGRLDDARVLRRIADTPIAFWAGNDIGPTRAYLARASAAQRQPLLVAYNIPGRDCGSYSAGGAGDGAGYRAWVGSLAAALGNQPATVILEPDAIPHAVNGCGGGAERYAMLADAVRTLKAAGPVRVYVDAGNPGFPSDLAKAAEALRSSGVTEADGFSLNVSNFYPTDAVISHGKRLSELLSGAHFVVDTSRNGHGPLAGPGDGPADGTIDGGPAWCNPPGRGLGQAPTTQTGNPAVDAFLWIKRPGESDGACRPGEPTAGTWWPDFALGLAQRAT